MLEEQHLSTSHGQSLGGTKFLWNKRRQNDEQTRLMAFRLQSSPKHPGQLPEFGDKNTACKSSNPQSQNRHVFFIVFFFKYTLIIETDFRNPITSHHSHLSFCHCCSRISSFKQQLGITSNTEVRIWSCTACQKDGRWSPPEAVAMDRIARFS